MFQPEPPWSVSEAACLHTWTFFTLCHVLVWTMVRLDGERRTSTPQLNVSRGTDPALSAQTEAGFCFQRLQGGPTGSTWLFNIWIGGFWSFLSIFYSLLSRKTKRLLEGASLLVTTVSVWLFWAVLKRLELYLVFQLWMLERCKYVYCHSKRSLRSQPRVFLHIRIVGHTYVVCLPWRVIFLLFMNSFDFFLPVMFIISSSSRLQQHLFFFSEWTCFYSQHVLLNVHNVSIEGIALLLLLHVFFNCPCLSWRKYSDQIIYIYTILILITCN